VERVDPNALFTLRGIESSLEPEAKERVICARVDEVARQDFRAIAELHDTLQGQNKNAAAERYIAPLQLDELRQARAAGRSIPYHRGWQQAALEATEKAAQAVDHAQHVQHLRAAASFGSPEAMTLLAECYREGRGVAADPLLALRWTHLAATRYHRPAVEQLARYFEKGVGMPEPRPIYARSWKEVAREIPPAVVARRRKNFHAAQPDKFHDYLQATWLIAIRLPQGQMLQTHWRFRWENGRMLVNTDALSASPSTREAQVFIRGYSAQTSKPYYGIIFQYGSQQIEGSLSGDSRRLKPRLAANARRGPGRHPPRQRVDQRR